MLARAATRRGGKTRRAYASTPPPKRTRRADAARPPVGDPMPEPMRESNVPGYPRRQGKVRDVYDLGDRLIIVATDRISAFDWVLPTPIPDKGRVLTSLTLFWLRWLNVPQHLLSVESPDFPPEFRGPEFAGRTMLVRKTEVVP